MIKPRSENNINKESKSEKLKKSPAFSDVDNNIDKTFIDRTKRVLDYLDSIGQGLYDPNRYAKLFGDKGVISDNLKNQFKRSEQSENDEVDVRSIFKNNK